MSDFDPNNFVALLIEKTPKRTLKLYKNAVTFKVEMTPERQKLFEETGKVYIPLRGNNERHR